MTALLKAIGAFLAQLLPAFVKEWRKPHETKFIGDVTSERRGSMEAALRAQLHNSGAPGDSGSDASRQLPLDGMSEEDGSDPAS